MQNLITRKSECKLPQAGMLIKSPKEITKRARKEAGPKYCIVVKPFHSSFLPYKQIIFKGVTFSDDFSIELIRNNDAVVIESDHAQKPEQLAHLFHANDIASYRLMS
jgi:hypothetical protein